jgi:hypothetical protein
VVLLALCGLSDQLILLLKNTQTAGVFHVKITKLVSKVNALPSFILIQYITALIEEKHNQPLVEVHLQLLVVAQKDKKIPVVKLTTGIFFYL